MSAFEEFNKKKVTTNTTQSTSGYDLTSKEGLQLYANQLGLGKEVEKIIKKEDKMGFLNRLSTGLNAFEIGNATYHSMVNNKNFFKTYFSDIGTGLYEAFTGKDITPEIKKTFKDVLTDEFKMKDRVGKLDVVDILGLAGDILLDPTTYIPAKWLSKPLKKAGRTAEKIIKKSDMGTDVFNAVEKGIAQLTSSLPEFKVFDRAYGNNIAEQTINRFRFNKAAKDGLLIDTGKAYRGLYKQFLSESKTKTEAIEKITKFGGDVTYYVEKGKDLNPLFKQFGLSDGQSELFNYIAGAAKEYQKELLEKGILEHSIQNRVARLITPEGRNYISTVKGTQLDSYIKGINASNPLKNGGFMKVISAREIMENNGIDDISKLSKEQLNKALDADDSSKILNFDKHKELKFIDQAKMSNKIEIKARNKMAKIDKTLDKAERLIVGENATLKALKAEKKKLQRTLTTKKAGTPVVEGVVDTITDDELVNAFTMSYLNKRIAKEETAIKLLKEKGVTKTPSVRTTKASTQWIKDRAEELLKKSGDNVENIAKYKKIAKKEFDINQAKLAVEKLNIEKVKIQNKVADDIRQIAKYDIIDKSGNLYVANRGTIREINQYSVKKHGFKLFEEDYFKAMTASNISSINKLDQFNYLNSIKEIVGVDNKGMANFLGSDIYTDLDGVKYIDLGKQFKPLKGVVVPLDIKDDIIDAANLFTGSKGESIADVIGIYDDVLRWFKSSVTGIFPAFHSRNFLSGVFNNYLAGVKNPLTYDEARKIFFTNEDGFLLLKNGTKMAYSEVKEQASRFLLTSSEGMMDAARKLEPFKLDGRIRVGDVTRKAMTTVETELRGTLFIDRLVKGDSITEAVKKVYKYHFDYEPWGLSKFENNIMKRVIPFFTFMRNNIPLQIEEIISQPGKYAGIMKTTRAMQGDITQQDKDNITPYMQNQFIIKTKDKIISGLGTPLEEALNQLQTPLHAIFSAMSPILKIPIEQYTDFNFFKQQPISSDSYGKKYKRAPKVLKDFLKFKEIPLGDDKFIYTVDPERKYWLDTLGLRGLSTTLSLINSVDTSSSVSKNAVNVFQKLITTINSTDLTIEDLTKYADVDAIKQVNDLLKRQGLISSFEKNYIPEAQREQLGVTSSGSIPKK